MKSWILSIFAGVALFAAVMPGHLHAQAATTPLERLQQLKAQRAKLIETQTATLQKLDDLAKEAQQMKTFARRT
jgi:hypothetical protein